MREPGRDVEGLRLPWSRSDRPIPRRVVRPLQDFLSTEAAGGVLLLAATLAALLWANSPVGDSYRDLWGSRLSMRLGAWSIGEDLRHWVNDALMALFFLVVGLEIKRELVSGELRDRRVAVLPVVGALGGMVAPALIYLALNAGGEGARGWAVPMPTDIAFALGVLTIAARRAPASLKPFLLTLAIVDDLATVLVFAIFYSADLHLAAIAVAGGLLVAMVALERIHVRSLLVYVVLGMGVWLATSSSGVHPTVAGVALGLLTPSVAFQRPRAVSEEAHRIADETVDEPDPPDVDAPQWLELAELSREAVSPLARIETALHPWTSFLIAPLFALANAGVALSASSLGEGLSGGVGLGIVLGRVAGKAIGITAASYIAVRLGVARLPSNASWWHMVGLAIVCGVGFTVSILIAELALAGTGLVAAAKIGIVVAAVVAGALAFGVLTAAGRRAER